TGTIWAQVRYKNICLPDSKKVRPVTYCSALLLCGIGARHRTYDLRVMSATSYQTAPPRITLVAGFGGSTPINVARILQIDATPVNPCFRTNRMDKPFVRLIHGQHDTFQRCRWPPSQAGKSDDVPGLPPGASRLPDGPAWDSPCVAQNRSQGISDPARPFPDRGLPWR